MQLALPRITMTTTTRPGLNQNIPDYMTLVETGDCPRYFKGQDKLSKAYEELRDTNPEGFKELMDFDYQQGRRDYVYRTGKAAGLGFQRGQPELFAGRK